MLLQSDDGPVVDVRGLPCGVRRAAIMDLFDGLQSGEGFVIVNDHYPAPLRGHFESRTTCAFTWDYVERGPTAWRVRVTRP